MVNTEIIEENIMAEFKKNDQITGMNTDFAQWYTDVVVKSEMVSYSNVKAAGLILNT